MIKKYVHVCLEGNIEQELRLSRGKYNPSFLYSQLKYNLLRINL